MDEPFHVLLGRARPPPMSTMWPVHDTGASGASRGPGGRRKDPKSQRFDGMRDAISARGNGGGPRGIMTSVRAVQAAVRLTRAKAAEDALEETSEVKQSSVDAAAAANANGASLVVPMARGEVPSVEEKKDAGAASRGPVSSGDTSPPTLCEREDDLYPRLERKDELARRMERLHRREDDLSARLKVHIGRDVPSRPKHTTVPLPPRVTASAAPPARDRNAYDVSLTINMAAMPPSPMRASPQQMAPYLPSPRQSPGKYSNSNTLAYGQTFDRSAVRRSPVRSPAQPFAEPFAEPLVRSPFVSTTRVRHAAGSVFSRPDGMGVGTWNGHDPGTQGSSNAAYREERAARMQPETREFVRTGMLEDEHHALLRTRRGREAMRKDGFDKLGRHMKRGAASASIYAGAVGVYGGRKSPRRDNGATFRH